ncbi:Gti1/Pac2 family-domain-containing protein [Roridomyces roridus]|uniref:Gti1/Pac2 family-domain-containing protein n=1 Tax=Roridomyces roridus TaxID=1738132 RepID=A0AAD7BWV4_9AGAR|nr:Gti1/Pac2 family-domain-containing protein [Roridomyces roridus]
MQQATHPRLHVRNAHDAHVVFEATRQGFLRPITRRLDETERATLVKSGAIFVWQEDDAAPGLKRWTDGRVWSQSRMREPYLFYDEQIGVPSEPNAHMQTYRFVDAASKGGTTSSAISHQERSTHIHRGLVKQAYSAWVMTHPNSTPRKWHITAYFRYDDLPHIPTVDLDPCLRRIIVPVGLYRDGKTRNRSDDSPPSTRSRGEARSPTLPSMFVEMPTLHDHGGRMTEDQRVIRMLNGNFFGK